MDIRESAIVAFLTFALGVVAGYIAFRQSRGATITDRRREELLASLQDTELEIKSELQSSYYRAIGYTEGWERMVARRETLPYPLSDLRYLHNSRDKILAGITDLGERRPDDDQLTTTLMYATLDWITCQKIAEQRALVKAGKPVLT